MLEPYVSNGAITVSREIHSYTGLIEIWEFRHLMWNDDTNYNIAHCHVCHYQDTTNRGIPRKEDRVSSSCKLHQVPDPVMEKFREQVANIKEIVDE